MQNYLHFPEEQNIHRANIGHTPISVLRDITSAQSTEALTGHSSSTRKAPAIPPVPEKHQQFLKVQSLDGLDTGHLLDGRNNKPQQDAKEPWNHLPLEAPGLR
jgi:hypothetical protein